MQEHTNSAANTVTDPTWAYVCLAIVIVLGAMTLFVLADSVIRVLIRRAQQRRELERWLADVEANQRQRVEAEQMLRTPKLARCGHRYGQWVCTAAPHVDEPRRHYYVAAFRAEVPAS